MPRTAIIHNHPIHYQDLLFRELKDQGLPLEVLFTATSATERINTPPPDAGGYPCRAAFHGAYEAAPRWATVRNVWSSLTSLAPEVVIIGGWFDAAAWTAWTWAGVHGVPRILWAESNHFDQPRTWWKERLKSLFVTRCQFAHVYGESNRDYLVRLGMSGDRIAGKRAVLNAAIFTSHDGSDAGQHTPRTLLYVGRFSPEKNLEFLLRAFAEFPRNPSTPDWLLALVGYGPLEQELRRIASELRLDAVVQFRGPAAQTALSAIYRSADVLVLPSVREPWGLVVLEAMACGLPVLVSDHCGCVRDLVNPGTGWTFSPSDRAAFCRLLGQLAEVPGSSLQAMGANAAALAREYAVENCAGTVISTVLAVLRSSSVKVFPTSPAVPAP
jgi:glycosyltransferase involved in cell wall biosynthesis